MTFTMSFPGDLKMPGNPFDVETPFGKPETIGKGDAFEERDELELRLDALTSAAAPLAEMVADYVGPDHEYISVTAGELRALALAIAKPVSSSLTQIG